MDFKSRFYPESRFGGFSDVDSTVLFYTRAQALARPDFVVLDAGCGRGGFMDDTAPVRRNLRVFKGKVRKVIGLDVDPAASTNPFVDEFHLIQGHPWPVPDASVDLFISDFVIEHLEDPDAFFRDVRRVLRPGGYACLRTPNAWGYVALCSRLIPNRYHTKVLGKVQTNRKQEDVFPTLYRCNSIPRMRAMFEKHGMEHVVYGCEGEPSYLSFSWFAYALGVVHQKLAPGFLKQAILAFGRVR